MCVYIYIYICICVCICGAPGVAPGETPRGSGVGRPARGISPPSGGVAETCIYTYM